MMTILAVRRSVPRSILVFFVWLMISCAGLPVISTTVGMPGVCSNVCTRHRCDIHASDDAGQQPNPLQYLTTRREAIIDYVRALQTPEGYFHAYLSDTPPFDPF